MRTLAFVLALTAASPAFAQNALVNDQLNTASISSDSVTAVHELRGNLQASSLAGGNTIGVEVAGNVSLNNTQRFFGNATATNNVSVGHLTGTGVVLTTAFSNNAEVEAASACCLSVNNRQIANIDPTAVSNVRINYAADDVQVSTSAFSNSLTVNGSGRSNMSVNSVQMNGAATRAISNVSIGSISGDLSTRASAIGNSVTLNNIPRN
jgi:hypothetical protein